MDELEVESLMEPLIEEMKPEKSLRDRRYEQLFPHGKYTVFVGGRSKAHLFVELQNDLHYAIAMSIDKGKNYTSLNIKREDYGYCGCVTEFEDLIREFCRNYSEEYGYKRGEILYFKNNFDENGYISHKLIHDTPPGA